MAFCTECGANVPDGTKFCTECGLPMGDAAKHAPVTAAPDQAAQQPFEPPKARQPVYAQAAPAQPVYAPARAPYDADSPPPRGSKYAPMGTGAYILYSILFALPLIGWLICIVTAFTAKNANKKSFAKAMLFFMVIGLILAVVLYFLVSWAMEAVMEYVNEATSGALGEYGGLLDMFKTFGEGGLPGQN